MVDWNDLSVDDVVFDHQQPEKIGVVIAKYTGTVLIYFVRLVDLPEGHPDNNRMVSFSKDFSDLSIINGLSDFTIHYIRMLYYHYKSEAMRRFNHFLRGRKI